MAVNNPKDSSRVKGIARDRRAKRQHEAVQRQAAANRRTPDEQIKRLRERGITSGREWDRLIAKINDGGGKMRPKSDKYAIRLPQMPKQTHEKVTS